MCVQPVWIATLRGNTAVCPRRFVSDLQLSNRVNYHVCIIAYELLIKSEGTRATPPLDLSTLSIQWYVAPVASGHVGVQQRTDDKTDSPLIHIGRLKRKH
jgi:hypothetical protein